MKLIDGKAISDTIKTEIANEVRKIIEHNEKIPHLAAIIVGDDPASLSYIASKEKACKEVGFMSSLYKYPTSVKEKDLLDIIDFLNKDEEIDGFIVQLPLPPHISTEKVITAIDPKKDIDGFHPENMGKMILGQDCLLPATPQGIMQLLERSNIETEGKHCVIIGRSNIVGTPLSILMSRNSSNANATVTLCHSKTNNLKEICLTADILIAAVGKPEFVKADMVKEGAVVIDVGVHRIVSDETKSGFKIMGDVDFAEVSKKCSYITPVPGGVGPMTIVSLLQNTFKASKG